MVIITNRGWKNKPFSRDKALLDTGKLPWYGQAISLLVRSVPSMIRQALSCSIGLLIAVLLCTPGCVGAAASVTPKPQAFQLPAVKQDCTTCHGPHQKGKGALLLKKPLDELCIECHPERTAPTEHTVGVIPSMTTGTLPLRDNKLTCITCHDPHSNRYGRMLRVPAKDLCQSCHLK